MLLNLLPKNFFRKVSSDHPHVNLGKVLDKKFKKFEKIAKPNIKKNLNIENDEIALIKNKSNVFAGIQLDYKTDPLRKLKRFFIKIQNIRLRKILSVFSFIILKLNGLYFKLGFFFNKYYKYSFEFFFSQPKWKKSYQFSNNIDKFGLRKIDIKWNIKNKDLENYNELIKETIGTEGHLIKLMKTQTSKKFTIMGLLACTLHVLLKLVNLNNGVVNSNLKLFDYENIYICGSSVFPFVGYTNPTWTITTLSLRLSKD